MRRIGRAFVQGWKDPEMTMPIALNQSWTFFLGDPLPQSMPDLGYLSITGDKGGRHTTHSHCARHRMHARTHGASSD
jgi:hypothetical protein